MTPPHAAFVPDLTRVLSGPYCTMRLGALGARVVRVEWPRKDNNTRSWGSLDEGPNNAYFPSANRDQRVRDDAQGGPLLTPLTLSDIPASFDAAPPGLGQHSSIILTNDLPVTRGKTAWLRARGAI